MGAIIRDRGMEPRPTTTSTPPGSQQADQPQSNKSEKLLTQQGRSATPTVLLPEISTMRVDLSSQYGFAGVSLSETKAMQSEGAQLDARIQLKLKATSAKIGAGGAGEGGPAIF